MSIGLAILAATAFLVASISTILIIRLLRSEKRLTDLSEEFIARGRELVRIPRNLKSLIDDPRTPPVARWMAIGLMIYLISPIDLIPDFLPVIGQLDDIVIAPVVLWSNRKRIPDDVWRAHFSSRPTGSVQTPEA